MHISADGQLSSVPMGDEETLTDISPTFSSPQQDLFLVRKRAKASIKKPQLGEAKFLWTQWAPCERSGQKVWRYRNCIKTFDIRKCPAETRICF